MVSGIALLVIIFLAVVLIVLAVSVFKLHPFLALLGAIFFTGLAVGVPLKQILDSITQGFGNLLGGIGLVVVLGSIIGVILEKTGAAIQIANLVIGLVGKQRPLLAMGFIGTVVGIPVFCDSGFIILSGLAKALAQKTGRKFAELALGLASGLYTTHVLVPPTPGPLACAGNLGLANHLGEVILWGLVISIPSTLVGIFFAGRFVSKLISQEDITEEKKTSESQQQLPTLPSPFLALLPIFLPILLISIASFISLTSVPEQVKSWIQFLGSPLIALCLALLTSFFLIKDTDKKKQMDFMNLGITQAGSILILTGLGGAFGALLKATPIEPMLREWLVGNSLHGAVVLLVAYLIAALLKTAQGSSTSALVITSSMLAPLLLTVGFDKPSEVALLVMAIGGGAMTVSHANDSYFWVVSQFGHLQLKEAYKSLTIMTLVQGISVLITTMLFFLFIQ
jgi:GntP family gluconate:H+ symporter